MSVSRELEILCSELRSDDFDRGWVKTEEMRASVREGIALAANQRLGLARQFLQASQGMLGATDDEVDLRNSISRAYYACHHAARACCLARGDGDQRGHVEAIKCFAAVVQDEPHLRSLLGARAKPLAAELQALLEARQLADYSPYGVVDVWRPQPEDFRQLAGEACELAQLVVGSVEKFLERRRRAR